MNRVRRGDQEPDGCSIRAPELSRERERERGELPRRTVMSAAIRQSGLYGRVARGKPVHTVACVAFATKHLKWSPWVAQPERDLKLAEHLWRDLKPPTRWRLRGAAETMDETPKEVCHALGIIFKKTWGFCQRCSSKVLRKGCEYWCKWDFPVWLFSPIFLKTKTGVMCREFWGWNITNCGKSESLWMLSRCAVGCFHQAHSLKTTNLCLRGQKPGWPTDQTRSQTFQRSSVLLRGTENCWDVTDVMGMSLQMKECPLESQKKQKKPKLIQAEIQHSWKFKQKNDRLCMKAWWDELLCPLAV